MRSSVSFLALSLSVVSAAVNISTIERESSAQILPDAYIVELDKPASLGKRAPLDAHGALYAELDRRGVKEWKVRKEFNEPDLFVGASVKLNNPDDLAALADVDHVKAISPVYLLDAPDPVSFYNLTSTEDAAVNLPSDHFSSHVMTGVDKLINKGYDGKGVKIAILDTGIDYLHPDLGKGFGSGFKVSHGTDFVGDAYTGSNTPVPDKDPMDCNGHGTHVAGIIGANYNKVWKYSGVAPKASLGAYRVFGCSGGVAEDVLITGMIRAYNDGNDILSLSLGGPRGWTPPITAAIGSRIADLGRVVAIAAGNDGGRGAWYASAPGTGQSVISVASVENTAFVAHKINFSNKHTPITYIALNALKINGPYPIYATSTNTKATNDACSALPSNTPNLANSIVVIRLGGCGYTVKLANAAKFGAKYFLLYNDDVPSYYTSFSPYTAAWIDPQSAAYLVDQFVKKTGVKLTFPQNSPVSVTNVQGGLLSSFTSIGPTNDMYFKPSLAAPGGNIFSTYPRALGSYAILSGTSMATPFVAGSAALVLQAKGRTNPVRKSVRTLLEGTAVNVPENKAKNAPWASLARSGAGLINVYNAVYYGTTVSPTELQLNDTSYFKGTHKITVKNSSKKSQSYKVTHVPAGTLTTLKNGEAIPYPVPISNQYATAKFSTTSFTLKAGATTTFTVTITAPQKLDASTFPVYSGSIKIASATEKVSVSYLGVAASLKKYTVLDQTAYYFGIKLPFIITGKGDVQNGPATYTFKNGDYPLLVYRLRGGTPIFRVDLVPSTFNLPKAKRTLDIDFAPEDQVEDVRARMALEGLKARDLDMEIKAPTSALAVKRDDVFLDNIESGSDTSVIAAGVSIIGSIALYEWQPRNTEPGSRRGYSAIAWTTPRLIGGTTVPNGDYKILVRALKITGQNTQKGDYEQWLSPVIKVAVPK